ncbi:hypothetical protein [Streptomyces sp. NPDC058622]|uniref:hypothetical protein n=1 Tax=Streptomyces sp. NPDC058622 TaxID=3346562 RepID=UPI00365DDA28
MHTAAEQLAAVTDMASGHVPWPVTQLRWRRRKIFPEGVVLLATSFIECWLLPDGSLELS